MLQASHSCGMGHNPFALLSASLSESLTTAFLSCLCLFLSAFSVHRAGMSLPRDYGQAEMTRNFHFTGLQNRPEVAL